MSCMGLAPPNQIKTAPITGSEATPAPATVRGGITSVPVPPSASTEATADALPEAESKKLPMVAGGVTRGRGRGPCQCPTLAPLHDLGLNIGTSGNRTEAGSMSQIFVSGRPSPISDLQTFEEFSPGSDDGDALFLSQNLDSGVGKPASFQKSWINS